MVSHVLKDGGPFGCAQAGSGHPELVEEPTAVRCGPPAHSAQSHPRKKTHGALHFFPTGYAFLNESGDTPPEFTKGATAVSRGIVGLLIAILGAVAYRVVRRFIDHRDCSQSQFRPASFLRR